MSSKKRVLSEISNSLSNSFEDPRLIENASLYFEQKLDTKWGLLDFLQFRKKQKTRTKNKDLEFKLFKQYLLAKTKNMEIAIQNFIIKKFEVTQMTCFRFTPETSELISNEYFNRIE
ncbi:27816_t:CDS:1 [Gigaspora margarita]|uniref:27816_t:CDS:1 n=1 Tax=Gigaspora margarita TaxID=4874 RepID=A0ABN7V3H5_GIGMA|nr:27816_t:CDS:1 [Gigaspora margarita]